MKTLKKIKIMYNISLTCAIICCAGALIVPNLILTIFALFNTMNVIMLDKLRYLYEKKEKREKKKKVTVDDLKPND